MFQRMNTHDFTNRFLFLIVFSSNIVKLPHHHFNLSEWWGVKNNFYLKLCKQYLHKKTSINVLLPQPLFPGNTVHS